MSNAKILYWYWRRESTFLDKVEIKLLKRKGDQHLVNYERFIDLSLNSGGKLINKGNPLSIGELAILTDRSEEDIEESLQIMEELGLVENTNGCYCLCDFDQFRIGQSSSSADNMYSHRQKQKEVAASSNTTMKETPEKAVTNVKQMLNECDTNVKQMLNENNTEEITNDRHSNSNNKSNSQSKRNNKNFQQDKMIPEAVFIPPTFEEIASFLTDQKIDNVSPVAFIDYYSRRDWRVGNKKMNDWKNMILIWSKKNKYNKPNPEKPTQEKSPESAANYMIGKNESWI